MPISEPFDLELFLKAIDLYNGKHDFSAFTTQFGRKDMIKHNKNPVKTVKIGIYESLFFRILVCYYMLYFINLVEVRNGRTFLEEHFDRFCEQKNYKIIEIEIQAESFLYKMIRKLMGVATNVACGKLPIEEIPAMLSNPIDFYEVDSVILSPNGLFLKSVNYNEVYLENKRKM